MDLFSGYLHSALKSLIVPRVGISKHPFHLQTLLGRLMITQLFTILAEYVYRSTTSSGGGGGAHVGPTLERDCQHHYSLQ